MANAPTITPMVPAWQTRLMMNGIGDLFGDGAHGQNKSEQHNDIASASFAAMEGARTKAENKSKSLSQEQVLGGAIGTTSSLDFLKAFSSGGALLDGNKGFSESFGQFANFQQQQDQVDQPKQPHIQQLTGSVLAAGLQVPVSFPKVIHNRGGTLDYKKLTGEKRKAETDGSTTMSAATMQFVKRKAETDAATTMSTAPMFVHPHHVGDKLEQMVPGSVKLTTKGKHAHETAAEKQERVRQRNRVHARSCRIRKRQAMDQLQTKVQSLESENNTLKQAFRVLYNQKELTTAMVISEFGEKGVAILDKLRRSGTSPQ